MDTKREGAAPGASRLLETNAVPWVCGLNTYVQSPLLPMICNGVPDRTKPKRLSAMSGCPRSEATLTVVAQTGPPIGLRLGQSSIDGGVDASWAEAIEGRAPRLSTDAML